ncbi:MAG: hypothetical protein HYY62_00355 [Deltaproteobacteria bacterium]|nr:hypothetical protein [Deltaproteobacteria bacterium]
MKLTYILGFLLFTSLLNAAQSDAKSKAFLNAQEVWYGNNKEKLEAFIHHYGKQSPAYDPHHKPVAAFDWDNTVIKNDSP